MSVIKEPYIHKNSNKETTSEHPHWLKAKTLSHVYNCSVRDTFYNTETKEIFFKTFREQEHIVSFDKYINDIFIYLTRFTIHTELKVEIGKSNYDEGGMGPFICSSLVNSAEYYSANSDKSLEYSIINFANKYIKGEMI